MIDLDRQTIALLNIWDGLNEEERCLLLREATRQFGAVKLIGGPLDGKSYVVCSEDDADDSEWWRTPKHTFDYKPKVVDSLYEWDRLSRLVFIGFVPVDGRCEMITQELMIVINQLGGAQ